MAQFLIGHAIGKTAKRYPGLQKFLWRLDFVLVWLLVKLFALLPVDRASRLGRHLGRVVGRRLKRKTAVYRENLSRAFPQRSAAALEQLVTAGWGNGGRVLAEYPHFRTIVDSRDRERLHIQWIGEGDRQRPAIFVGAHQSNWELIICALNRLSIPSMALYTPPSNPLLERMLFESRRQMNCELVPRQRAARGMVRNLQSGRSVAVVIDRRLDGGTEIPFFGIPKPSSLLPAKLALKFCLDLIPTQVQRLRDAEFRVTFHAPVLATEGHGDENQRARDMTAQLHHHFQSWISDAPEAWFCPQRIWPGTAPGAGDQRSPVEADGHAG